MSWVQQSGSPVYVSDWQSVACSSDGTKLVAVINATTGTTSGIYRSTDSGATWIKSDAPAANWQSVACNETGETLVAVIKAISGTTTGIYRSPDYGATWIKSTGTPTGIDAAPAANWQSVASDETGEKLVAVISATSATTTGIYTSNDSGASWTKSSSAPAANWQSVASDSSGQKLVAVINANSGTNSGIYTSNDYGATWTKSTGTTTGTNAPAATLWQSVASDSTGEKLVAVITANSGTNTGIYTSNDYGVSWIKSSSAPAASWQSVASSANGTKLVAVINDPNSGGTTGIYTSNDSGASWTKSSSAPAGSWYSVAFDSTGTKLVAVSNNGIYKSTDLGANWIIIYETTSASWKSIASDSTGQKLVGISTSGIFYTSNDYGATWTKSTGTNAPPAANWQSVASDSTGQKLVAVINYHYSDTNPVGIYTSNDYGVSWIKSTGTTSGTNAPPAARWQSVASDSSGQKLVAVINANSGTTGIYTSNDYGVSWIKSTGTTSGTNAPPAANWQTVASDSSGQKLVAVINANSGTTGIYTSNDYGVSWTKSTGTTSRTNAPPAARWQSVASDSTGQKLVAVINAPGGTSGIYTSNDYGVSWIKSTGTTSRTNAPPAAFWQSVASDSSGQKLVAVINANSGTTGIYTSNDYGVSWIKSDAPAASWQSVACSSDGTKLVAVSSSMAVWTYTDPTPQTSQTPQTSSETPICVLQ